MWSSNKTLDALEVLNLSRVAVPLQAVVQNVIFLIVTYLLLGPTIIIALLILQLVVRLNLFIKTR